jgi:hypothetical protein
MTPLATSTFLQVMFAMMIAVPVIILWVAAVVDVFRQGYSGLKIAGLLLLILVLPILGPVLYFVFRRPTATPESIEAQAMAEADRRRETAGRAVGGPGTY